jgi:23S rRNA (uracil747-C5)-methyltransferase
MAKDLAAMPDYRVERVQLFDMFPHTAHYEVLTLLSRR